VSAMPTFQLFKNGKKIDETVGYNASAIETMIKKAGGSLGAPPSKAE
jgi:thioredoxin-like negative regulator of GroEL